MADLVLSDFRGGRNGIDSITDPTVPSNQVHEAWNVDFSEGPLGRRRGGAETLALTGGTAFATAIASLSRFLPTGNETTAELFGVDSAGLMKRLAGGVAWANVTLDHAISSLPQNISWATLNGKHYCAYKSASNRMHLYDPDLAVPRMRPVGINPGTNPPTVANQGAGAYAASPRYYRIRFIQVSGGVVKRRSEPTPASVSFTPSGAGASARVTIPVAPGEGETHWEVDASTDNANWNKLVCFALGTHVAIATTFYDDVAVTSTYRTLDISDEIGFYTLLPGAEFIVTDNNRLVMTGDAFGTVNLTSRIWFTPVLGSSDQGDDERLVINARLKTFVDLNEKDGGRMTGLAQPMGGTILAFKYRKLWRLSPTSDSDVPYIPRLMSPSVGCIDHSTIVMGEDAGGRPCIYWWSHRGPYRWGADGIQYLGRDIEDYSQGLKGKSKVNLDATTKVGHGGFYSELGQVWWWMATGASNVPNVKFVLDVKQASRVDRFGVRGGWAVHDGASAGALCNTMFAETVAASMSRRLKPYVGLAASATVLKCDTGTMDNLLGFQAYVKSRSIVPAEAIGGSYTVAETILSAQAQAGTVIRQTLIKDYGVTSAPDEQSIAPEGVETDVLKKFTDGCASDIGVVQVQLGDPADVAVNPWVLNTLTIPMGKGGDL